MTSELRVDKLNTVAGGTGNIVIPTGVKLVGTDAGSVYAPGGVLQVVESVNTTQQSTTSTAATATGITGSITPSSSSSKIFVFCNYTGYITPSGVSGYYAIYRGATNITSPQGTRLEAAGGTWFGTQVLSILDSPATTSSTTYTLYFWVQSGATSIVNISSSPGRMILMEIAQ